MTVKMNDVQLQQFNKMVKQSNEMFDMLTELKEVIVGNPEYQRPGILHEMKEMKQAVKDHDKADIEKFDKIFEYQKKQQLFAGWTSIFAKALWAIALMGIGHFITVVFKV